MTIEARSDITLNSVSAFFSGTVSSNAVTVTFTDGNASQIVTITNAGLSAATPPLSLYCLRPGSIADNDDMELTYVVNLLSVATGSCVIRVTAEDPEGDDVIGLPLPDIIVQYAL